MNIEYYIIDNYYLVVINKGLAFDFLPDSYTFILLNNNNFLNYLYRIVNSITFKDVKLNDTQEMVVNKIINNNFIIKTIIKSLYKTYDL